MDSGLKDEIKDLLLSLEDILLKLEADQESKKLLEDIFRDLHTIKGAAYMFDLQDHGDFAHQVENLFDDLRAGKYAVNKDIIQLSFECIDFLKDGLKHENFSGKKIQKSKNLLTEKINVVKDAAALLKPSPPSEQEPHSFLYLLEITPKIEFSQDDGHPIHFTLEDFKSERHLEEIEFRSSKKKEIKAWKIFFHSELSLEEVKSLFLFIEDDFDFAITGFSIIDVNILPDLFELINNFLNNGSGKQLVDDIKKTVLEFGGTAVLYEEENQDENAETINSPSEEKVENSASDKSDFIKVSRSKIDNLMSWVSELITMQATLKEEADKFESEALYRVSENMEFITENLRETIFSVSLVPIKNLETRFKRIIRDLSSSKGIEANLVTKGTETELDKKIIDTLMDPLLHIIRNCFGHGLETAEERKRKGKDVKGTITIDSYYSGNNVIIEISDDGKGIDTEKVRSKAVEKGLLGTKDNLKEEDIFQLIFHPGFSTADQVDDVSGRGVGMDVVRKKIQEIRGEVLVESKKDEGTKFIIKIPLSLSIIEGLLTKVGNTHFVLPLSTVREIHRVKKEAFANLPHGSQILEIEGNQMPVISLEKSFGLRDAGNTTADIITVDVGLNKKGIAVDLIKGQIKAVLKPLSEYYEAQEFISGGTILGDGSLALILNMDSLITKN